MIAETDRIQVRPLIEADLADYQRILRIPAMAVANGSPVATAPDLMANWFEQDRHSPFAFAVIDRAHRRFVGAIFYYQHEGPAQTRPVGTYDLGYFLDPNMWGKGLMPEAVQASFDLVVRGTAGPVTLWADCLTTNHRSQRVLEKLGFVPGQPGVVQNPGADAVAVNWFSKQLD
ncbi:GNAT family N-acetyltransferase [Levilactobacillus namurensis]|uniref:GNAT family N-acetyltransferase n=1 Tax=Levilactobacillus namurensis TaxID=380393 RepID=UPI0022310BE7|nr:GNAT family N-acetyltransferase [Levilactobacillus namurensis]MCW3779247.1 GNAT family N-acetyltransferase [Levilactobacillus namurensis]MDT7019828.1 GNAT family N-acetyltransferase [Levilactobacillus namurensis]WNN65588.1 GNAT family N-acetyltransferase [Levilactobacillus namurensis]